MWDLLESVTNRHVFYIWKTGYVGLDIGQVVIYVINC